MAVTDRLVIGIVVGSTRSHRRGDSVAGWLVEICSFFDAEFVLLDLADFALPHLDEPEPARRRYRPAQAHTARWAAAVGACDGFVVITPEYNHSFPGVLKNALDYLHSEWEDKAVGFVSYGGYGGVRAVEHLRSVCGQLKMADVRAQPALSLAVDFDEEGRCDPSDLQIRFCHDMLDEVISWASALKALRTRVFRPPDGRGGVVVPGVQ
ncbi:MAG: azo1 [Amycolatopsis sp.]|uniref:NADPH-dependent FMN reductase n=1 Tax=Amycolatopsis sp. TaxID=37632 RepID=UPI0026098FA1|nr:NAD(P)H-dependent oxidoreductase [Amycolatopsis sp.]MCU1686732.1 azo1 [Amycolatopsis sp.]